MREISECTAEVFRRSEKRIKERKRNRNRILAFCIPLCLIVAVFSVMILPAMTMRTKNENAEMVGDTSGGSVFSYNTVEIHDGSRYEKVTDKVAVTRIYNAVCSLFEVADGEAQGSGESFEANKDNSDNAPPTEAASKLGKMSCTIAFTDEYGSQTVYILSENTILNVNTNETIFLSDDQVARLMIAFQEEGIT